jgi:LacI family transcriptional regulator, galactose operon repressor
MAVRMKDLARDLGVSVVTISKVLRNHSDISAETRARVLKRMKELNYRPNLTARALVTGRTHAVGLIVPDLVHPFFSVVAKGLSNMLRERGYGLLIASSQEDPSLEQREIDQLLSRRVDALVIASAQLNVEAFRRIEEIRTPYVLIDRRFAGLAANFVGVDDERVGEIATEHLIEQGCRRIAHLRGPSVSTSIGRMTGYQRALSRHGMTPLPGYIVAARSGDDQSHISGGEAMRKLLELDPRPDGVFCYNDPTALGAMKTLLDAGVRIPADIAVIGCGNVLYSELLRVPLSSVDQRSGIIGEQAGMLALSLVEAKGASEPKSILMEPRLVARASSLKS